MVTLFSDWYKRNFSDPNAVTLLVILICTFLFVYFFSNLLMPVFVAVAIAFLLDLPVNKLNQIGLSRTLSVVMVVSAFVGFSLLAILGLMPVIWQQSSNLFQEVPQMVGQGHTYLLALPQKYPDLVSAEQIGEVIKLVNDKFIEWGQVALKASLNSISDVVAHDLLTSVYQKQNKSALAHASKAEIFALLGAYPKAIDELQTGYNFVEENPLLKKRMKGRILQLQEQQEKLKRL